VCGRGDEFQVFRVPPRRVYRSMHWVGSLRRSTECSPIRYTM
ncbi:hypothetical protein AB1N83_006203, partial [Pleurotus pulmonarius]